jgi:2-C-methyl-D-erythritol 4-phosphate cytidylyltransferase
MGPGLDKLFLEINGQPVIGHTWLRFDRCAIIGDIVLVIRDGMQSVFEAIAPGLGLTKPWRLAVGGHERQDSVWNGLAAISPTAELVAIHDGARPCVTHAAILETVRAAAETGAGVAAQPVTDTIKESPDGQFASRTVDRSKLYAVQTPQVFRVSLIRSALEEVRRRGLQVTDDTAACELIGHRVKL